MSSSLAVKKIVSYKQLDKLRKQASAKSKTIVFTMGSYDVLHLGHLTHFDCCKQQGDILVVGIGSDKTIRSLKGPSRPINNQRTRAKLLTYLSNVDYVVISEEDGPLDIIDLSALLKPDVFVLPENDSQLKQRKTLLESQGSKVVICERTPPPEVESGISTTKIIEQLNEL